MSIFLITSENSKSTGENNWLLEVLRVLRASHRCHKKGSVGSGLVLHRLKSLGKGMAGMELARQHVIDN